MLRTKAKFLTFLLFSISMFKEILGSVFMTMIFPFSQILRFLYLESCLVCFCRASVSLLPLHTVYFYTLGK